MATLQSKYNQFIKNIILTRESDEYKKARDKDDIVTPKVEDALNDAGYHVQARFLQGSLASNIAIKPLDGDYDIDRAVVITKESSPENPVDVKKIVRDVLIKHGFKEPKIKKPCVTADYKNENYHIDFPIYRIDENQNYQLAVGKEFSDENNREWANSEPKKLKEWIASLSIPKEITDDERSQYYRLVRYLKRWRDFVYTSEVERKKVYSIALTIMVKESFSPCIDNDGKVNDNQALIDTLTNILKDYKYFIPASNGYEVHVNLPVTPYSDTFQKNGETVGTLLRKRMQYLLDALNETNDMSSLKKQCEKLRQYFGDDFPESEDEPTRDSSRSAGLVGVSNGA